VQNDVIELGHFHFDVPAPENSGRALRNRNAELNPEERYL